MVEEQGEGIGLVVDLAFTSRYYNAPDHLGPAGIQYKKFPVRVLMLFLPQLMVNVPGRTAEHRKEKMLGADSLHRLQVPGHASSPPRSTVVSFMELVANFRARNPGKYVAVHCTHGLNRSGFFIVTYLVEQLKMALKDALKAFAEASPPGIFDRSFLAALYQR